MKNFLAIIPARGGSKRIPKKNIRLFCGKPMIAYSIEAALKSGLFKRVIVSTDSEEIAKVARDYGAQTPFMRPEKLSDDYAGHAEVLAHALEEEQTITVLPDFFCCLYATAPFVNVDSLTKGYEILKQKQADASFSVGTFGPPVFRALKTNGEGLLKPIWPEFVESRSNDLPVAYHDAGQFYWYRTEAFLQEKTAWLQKSAPVILERHLVQDIDTLEDWEFAEKLFRL